jgi:phospholipid/cholesterol/gamma-HCH transport system substrate-binding protein
MKFRMKHADQIVGLFVFAAVALMCLIIILLGINQRWFAKNYNFKSQFSSGNGIAPGTAIMMRGFQVGKIKKITLNKDNQVDVDFYIFDTYYEKVRQFSLLELSVSPIGLGSQLLFHPGKGDSVLAEGSFVPSAESPEGLAIIEQNLAEIPVRDDTISRLIAGLNPLLENASRTLTTVNRTLTEFNRALAGQSTGPMGEMVQNVALASKEFPRVVTNASNLIADVEGKTGALLDEVQSILTSVNAISASLAQAAKEMEDPTGLVPKLLDPKGSLKTFLDDNNELYNKVLGMMDDVEQSMQSLSSIMGAVNSEMPKIASILEEGKTTLQKTQDVLEGLKNNPLLRGGIPERQEQQSLYKSMREGDFQ